MKQNKERASSEAPRKPAQGEGSTSSIKTQTIRGERFSFVDGERYPHVTSIAGRVIRMAFLETWRGEKGNEEADRLRDEASEFGRLVHESCALAIQGAKINPSPEVAPLVDTYLEWADEMVSEVIAIEQVVANKKYHYAGQPDLIAVLKGDILPTVIDIKTGFVGDVAKLQTAAYRACVPGCDRRVIVPLDKKKPGKKVKIIEYKNHEADFQAFLNCLGIFRWLRS